VAKAPSFSETGLASWYGKDRAGNKMADGKRFDPHAMTAAHRSLPLATVARVTNVETGKTVKVKITDRGPFKKGRIVDLSASAASALDMREDGVAPVLVEVFESDQSSSQASLSATGRSLQ
jgi:rare lipoprotein A